MEIKFNIHWPKKEVSLDELRENIEFALDAGGVEAAKELCRNTKGKASAGAYITLELLQEHGL